MYVLNMDTSLGLETLSVVSSDYVAALEWLCGGCGMEVMRRLCEILWLCGDSVAAILVLMGHSLGFMLHMESSSLRPSGQRPYNGATPVGGGRWPFHPLILLHPIGRPVPAITHMSHV